MVTEDKSKLEGEAIHRAREDRKKLGGRSAEEIRVLREDAASIASICADCFTPLAPDASVTIVGRFVEHIPAHEEPNTILQFFPARDVHLPVPICLNCWLVALADPSLQFHLRRVRQDGHVNCASPARSSWSEFRRLRCENCRRPMRVETRQFRRLTLHERCCCAECLHKAKLKRANERRRVRHEARPCLACGTLFIPSQSTAKTCSNACRQRLFRQRQ